MKNYILIFFLSICFLDMKAQDPEFSQFYANPLYLNPALTGATICPRVSLNYRHQWPNIQGTYVTSSASFDRQVQSIKSGLGLIVMNDNAGAGTLKTTNISGLYSYSTSLGRHFFISFGGKATFAQKTVDWSKLNFSDQIDPLHGFIYNTQDPGGSTTRSYVDFSAGVLMSFKNYFAGFSADHLTEPDEYLPAMHQKPPKSLLRKVGRAIADFDMIRQGDRLQRYCEVHSEGGGAVRPDLVAILENTPTLREEREDVGAEPVPIQGETILGEDPYKSVRPVLRAILPDEEGEDVARKAQVVYPTKMGSEKARIKLDPPPPLKIE